MCPTQKKQKKWSSATTATFSYHEHLKWVQRGDATRS